MVAADVIIVVNMAMSTVISIPLFSYAILDGISLPAIMQNTQSLMVKFLLSIRLDIMSICNYQRRSLIQLSRYP